MAAFTSFDELECWKACREVVRWTMQVSSKFPNKEIFDLKDNRRRAARSSTKNIAEGFGRHHHGENIQYCRISRGSLFEVSDDAITALAENYITAEEYNQGRTLLNKAINITNGYIKYLNGLQNHPR